MSEFPFKDLDGKEGYDGVAVVRRLVTRAQRLGTGDSGLTHILCARSLRAAKVQSGAFEQFSDVKRMTEWVLPTANTVGQYVRIQLQKRTFLHVAEVEVFGVYSAFQTVGRVGAVHCTHDATLAVVPPTSHERSGQRNDSSCRLLAVQHTWCFCLTTVHVGVCPQRAGRLLLACYPS